MVEKFERTFIAIKPDAVNRGFVGEIISRFERKGFKLVAMKLLQPTKEIAEKLGISLNRVYYLLRICEVKPNSRNRKHDHEEVNRLKSEGLSAKEIADKLDIPLRSVYYILNKK